MAEPTAPSFSVASDQTVALVERAVPGLRLADLHEARANQFPYLLESVANGTPQSRFSILMYASGERLTLGANGVSGRLARHRAGFLDHLNGWFADVGPLAGESAMPFVGGWFLYLGYELAGEIEPVLKLPTADQGLPIAVAARCPGAIVRDHQSGLTYLVAEDKQTLNALRSLAKPVSEPDIPRWDPPAAIVEEPSERFERSLARVHEYILDGDVFQVNLSRGWRLEGTFPAISAYRRLCAANPAPFAASVRLGDRAIVSSSPERLVAVRDRTVSSRPIAGTRPRSADGKDVAMLEELLGHPKERAEHIMLIDLERNDLGRICQPGSVMVDELMVTESYAHVHHIVSNVTGVLKPAVTPGEVIAAVFPGGTITGCPKVRCMEIIAELEDCPREAYTGSLGYLDRRGNMDLNILIRTAVVDQQGLTFRAGAGLVADSVFESELTETRAKARGLTRAFSA